MKFVASQREVSLFMGVMTFIALCAVFTLGADSGRALDSLTGIAAGATGFVVVARLALGTPAGTTRRYWQIVLILLGLVCIAQFAGPFAGRGELEFGIGNGARYFVLVAAALLLSLIARFDDVPATTQRVLWLAFAIQVSGAGAVLLSRGPGL